MWRYQPVLNAALTIVLTMGVGALVGACGVMKSGSQGARGLLVFAWWVALPCLVTRGLGIGVDFYSDAYVWGYVAAFLVLRAAALLVAVLVALRSAPPGSRAGWTAALWLATTWISTIIQGIPILSALLLDPLQGALYGVMAAISSFIFQLPAMLALFEVDVAQQQQMQHEKGAHASAPNDDLGGDARRGVSAEDEEDSELQPAPSPWARGVDSRRGGAPAAAAGAAAGAGPSAWEVLRRRATWARIGRRLAVNPVLWSIAAGLVISLSTFGRYLNPASEKFVPELGWVEATLRWLGDTTSPLGLFATGLWMGGRGWRSLSAGWWPRTVLLMLAKVVLTPLLMVGLAAGIGLDSTSARAAVIISALPISLAGHILAERQATLTGADGVAEVVSQAVFFSSVLMLPAVLAWIAVMDALDLFV